MGWVVNTTLRLLYPREIRGIHCIGGWVGSRAGLNRCGNLAPHQDYIPGPSNPLGVAIQTELSRPIDTIEVKVNVKQSL